MIIEIPKIPVEGGAEYLGEEPAELLPLDRLAGCEAVGPIRYRLHAEIVSGGVLVRGEVSLAVRLQCSRCAEFFSTILKDSSFLRDCPLQEGAVSLCLDEDLREALLLCLPNYPVCAEACPGIAPAPPPAPGADETVWSALDALRPPPAPRGAAARKRVAKKK